MKYKGLLASITIILLCLVPEVNAQRSLARSKWEFFGGLGGANCLCDLGGANQVGTHFLRDFDLLSSHLSGALGVRYKVNSFFFIKSQSLFASLRGDDKHTKEPFRLNRNLNFKTPILSSELHLEGHFLKEQQGRRYYIKSARGLKNFYMQSYLFFGIGIFYYNPKGRLERNGNKEWVALRKLGTEGQGLEGQPAIYKPYSLSFPIGIGGKISIDKRWSIGIEYGMRFTKTDYIDDVSTVYFDKNKLLAERGELAAYLSNPALAEIGPGGLPNTRPGDQRGDPKHNDAYMIMNITLSCKIPPRRRTGRASF